MCTDKLKAIYSSIQKYQATSGFHWDNATGATIRTSAEQNVWNEYAKVKVCTGQMLLSYFTYDYLHIFI